MSYNATQTIAKPLAARSSPRSLKRRLLERPRRIGGAIIGTLVALSDAGEAFVTDASSPEPRPARSTIEVLRSDIGKEVVMMFERGNTALPIVLGRLRSPSSSKTSPSPADPIDVKFDGRTLSLVAEQELVLRCGKASITLTRAGKVIIRGAYLLSRSSGANRIKGGSVQIN